MAKKQQKKIFLKKNNFLNFIHIFAGMKTKRKMRRIDTSPKKKKTHIKRKRKYRVGSRVGKHFVIIKEHLPQITNGGKKKRRKVFVQCHLHRQFFYLFKVDRLNQGFQGDNGECSCLDGGLMKYMVPERDVRNYNYMREVNKRNALWRKQHPSWFKVDDFTIHVHGHLFYTFRGVEDYFFARRIENIIWNQMRHGAKAIFLYRFADHCDTLHRAGRLDFYDQPWNRGSTGQFFMTWLEAHGDD